MSSTALDTNVLIQLYESVDAERFETVERLLAQRPVISAQVLSEFLNVIQRITRLPKAQILADAIRLFGPCTIAPVTYASLQLAARLLARYDFQLFDALIVAAALEADCTILYSADFQHNQLVESRLRIINPSGSALSAAG